MKKIILKQTMYCLSLVVCVCLLFACDHFGAKTIPASTALISTSLAGSSDELNEKTKYSVFQSTECSEFAECVTPDNVSGKVYYAGIMVGTGSTGYSLGPIIGDVIDPSQTGSFSPTELLDFDMAQQITADGSMTCCEGSPYPPDEEAYARAVEILFGYVDVDFSLEDSSTNKAVSGEHTVRTVYGDITGTEYKKGDLLYLDKEDNLFKWCTPEAGCTHVSRPENPLQYEDVANYSGTPDGVGNQIIPSFAAELPTDHPSIQLTESDVLSHSWMFTIDFDMTGGVVFTDNLTSTSTISDLVRAFRLAAAPGSRESGFTVRLTAEKTPLTTGDNETDPEQGDDNGTDQPPDSAAAEKVLPYNPQNSLVLADLIRKDLKYYEYKYEWDPGKWRKHEVSSKHMIKMYPFPLVQNFDRNRLLKNNVDITEMPSAAQWEHIGIQGVGVVKSVTYDKNNTSHLLMGTEGSGLYKSTDFGTTWQKLDFPRNDIRHVIIDADNPDHYIVTTGIYLFTDLPTTIYRSSNAGQSWDTGNNAVTNQYGTPTYVTPSQIHYLDGYITVAGTMQGFGTYAVARKYLAATTYYTVTLERTASWVGPLKIKDTGMGLITFYDEKLLEKTGDEKEWVYEDSLYKTEDAGTSWTMVFSPEKQGLEDYDITAYDISEDGQRIYLFLKSKAKQTNIIAKSFNGGIDWTQVEIQEFRWMILNDNWEYTLDDYIFKYTAQDLVLDEENEDYIALFIYMNGFFDSFNGGVDFTKFITNYQDVYILNGAAGEAQVIEPMDLRIDTMTEVQTQQGDAFLIPTDQGLHYYDGLTGTLQNLAPDLFLADSGIVSVSPACPRIYSGLWHIGSYWINPDNSIEGFNGGENWGYGIGPDDGCDTPVFSPVHGYLGDGKNVDEDKSEFFQESFDYGWPIEETFSYYDGWWYVFRWWGSMWYLVRINEAFSTYEILYPDNDTTAYVKAYGMDTSVSGSPIWVLDHNLILWKFVDGDWFKWKNLDAVDYDIKNIIEEVNGIKVYKDRIILYGHSGMYISVDQGKTWYKGFEGEKIWALAQDKCGTIYMAVQPDPDSNLGGVYYSNDNGKTIYKLGTGDSKSYISSLAIDHANDVMYAGTAGESILRITLEDCAGD